MFQRFNSEAEQDFTNSEIYKKLNIVELTTKFDQEFLDSNNEPFYAKPDFYHEGSQLYIEFKVGGLNGVGSQRTSRSQLLAKESYRGLCSKQDHLKFGWHHSRHKQKIVQTALIPQNFIIVFRELPIESECLKYLKQGIVFIPISALPSYLAYAKFAKYGLHTGFNIDFHGTTYQI